MIHTGLVSITFRKLSPEQVIDLVAQAGLESIEWGGDVHVPHGDTARARAVRQWTADAGLETSSYGSYYRVGHSGPVPFEAVVETAVELGAPIVRVWAGKHGSADVEAGYRSQVVEDSRHIADLAQQAGLLVAYEFHGNTLTDTNESALHLLEQVAHESIVSYWQPMRSSVLSPGGGESYRLEGLRALVPWLTNLHVFHWDEQGARCPLGKGEALWRERLGIVRDSGQSHHALIEFVQADDPGAFLRDAAALRNWARDEQDDGIYSGS